MSQIQANLSNSKEYQALKAQFPSEKLPTDIVEGNKHCFSFLGYTITANGTGTKLDWKLFSMTKELYRNHEAKKTLIANNFGHAVLVMIHNPILMEQQEKEAAEKEAELKAKEAALELEKAKAEADKAANTEKEAKTKADK